MYRLSIVFILACFNGYAIAYENILPNTLKHESASGIRNNNLNYIILYNRDSFEALVEYDVKFDDNSSTNGVVQKISGSYNKLVQTEKLQLSGSQTTRESNNIVIDESHTLTYWVDGVIEPPLNKEAIEKNKKALRVNVKIDKTIIIKKNNSILEKD